MTINLIAVMNFFIRFKKLFVKKYGENLEVISIQVWGLGLTPGGKLLRNNLKQKTSQTRLLVKSQRTLNKTIIALT